MSTRVYRYGMPRPPLEVRDAVDEQLHLAHRYRLALWQLACASRAVYREMRRAHFPELVDTEAEIERISSLLSEIEKIDDKRERAEMRKHAFPQKSEMQRLKARAKELRAQAKTSAEFTADVAAAKEREGVLGRSLRRVFSRVYGLYSGTYLCVEDAARRARSGSRDPVRPRWDGARTRDFRAPRRLHENHGSGILGIQLQGGRSVSDLYCGRDPSIRLRQTGPKRAIASYRLRSRLGQAVLVDLPVVICRPLPHDAKITWAKLVVSRVGLRCDYSLQLTVESDTFGASERGAGVAAVCLADDRIVYRCEYGEEAEFVPPPIGTRHNDVLSGRDRERNAMIGALLAWSERQDELPDWLRDELERQEVRPSARSLARLCSRMRHLLDDRARKAVESWLYHENHLYAWQSDMRASALRRRRDAYRVFARQLRRRFRTLLVDARRLDDPMRLTAARRDLGLHELRTALTNAFGDDIVLVTGASCMEMFERFREDVTNGKGSATPSEIARVGSKGQRSALRDCDSR